MIHETTKFFGHVYNGSMMVFFSGKLKCAVNFVIHEYGISKYYGITAWWQYCRVYDMILEYCWQGLLGLSLFGCFGEGVRSYGQGQRWGFVSVATLPQSNVSSVDFVTWSCWAGKRNLCACVFMAEPYLHLVIVVFPCCFAYRKSRSVFFSFFCTLLLVV